MNKLFLCVTLLAVATLSACTINKNQQLTVSADGMTLVKATRSTQVAKNENVDFTRYDKILISPSTVTFKKDWKRDYNRDERELSMRVEDKDVIRIKEGVEKLFDEVFQEELAKSTHYSIVTKAEPGTLLLKPSVLNLEVNAPDLESAVNVKRYTDTTGEGTLLLEVFDGVSGQIVARIIDAEEAGDNDFYEWASRVSNRADAKRVIRKWAKSLREHLDKAHTSPAKQ
ncbi:DUF3313 family protein [Shewanella sp. YLB-07]|uniref:DUF3313 family protein n=1 Tax=Shewanella sp. YLB-07 TaxID=2601268 RepID=UPI00128BF432|nr:DUF3313 family protein [Shewanella sp. YLB-07]MPY21139.1 DUF3313 domain-containing protein [Shewanella sp. YLB-07]MPY21926.1 DUF3313 domain-containing protein [Shewanella sp. YLB-07]